MIHRAVAMAMGETLERVGPWRARPGTDWISRDLCAGWARGIVIEQGGFRAMR